MLEIKTRKDKSMTIRLSQQEYDFIKNNADKMQVSITDLIKLSVNSYISQQSAADQDK